MGLIIVPILKIILMLFDPLSCKYFLSVHCEPDAMLGTRIQLGEVTDGTYSLAQNTDKDTITTLGNKKSQL